MRPILPEKAKLKNTARKPQTLISINTNAKILKKKYQYIKFSSILQRLQIMTKRDLSLERKDGSTQENQQI